MAGTQQTPTQPSTTSTSTTSTSTNRTSGTELRTAPVEVLVHPNEEVLAAAVAARLITRLIDVQAARHTASIVLTGGGIGIASLAAVADSPAQSAVDWSRIDVYWGDERFVPADSDERNEKQAREALLDRLPFDPDRIHPMPPAGGEYGDDIEAASRAYAELLAAAAPDESAVPHFDVLMLGMGPEGHTASMFPESPAVRELERSVVRVEDCPKPPPRRISLTRPAIASADEVWLLAAGKSKAEALAHALRSAGPVEIPAASARGRRRSLWLVDRAAASQLSG